MPHLIRQTTPKKSKKIEVTDKVEQGVCLRVSRRLSSNTAIILCSDHSVISFVRGKVELLETNAIGKGLDWVSHL